MIISQSINQLAVSHNVDTIYMWCGSVAASLSAGRPSGLAASLDLDVVKVLGLC
jgi:hypothetical protein